MASYADAFNRARRLAKKHERDYYVIRCEPGDIYGPFTHCDDETLDTFYNGLSQDRILYCTEDDPLDEAVLPYVPAEGI